MREKDFYKKLLDEYMTDTNSDTERFPSSGKFDEIEKRILLSDDGISHNIKENTENIENAESNKKIRLRRGGFAAACVAAVVFCTAGVFAALNSSRKADVNTRKAVSSQQTDVISDMSSESDTDSSINNDTPDEYYNDLESLISASGMVKQILYIWGDVKDGYLYTSCYDQYVWHYDDSKMNSQDEHYQWSEESSGQNKEYDVTMYETYFPLGDDSEGMLGFETGKVYVIFTVDGNKPVNDRQWLFEVNNGVCTSVNDPDGMSFTLSQLYFSEQNDMYDEQDINSGYLSNQKAMYDFALEKCKDYMQGAGLKSCTLSQPYDYYGDINDPANIYVMLDGDEAIAAFALRIAAGGGFEPVYLGTLYEDIDNYSIGFEITDEDWKDFKVHRGTKGLTADPSSFPIKRVINMGDTVRADYDISDSKTDTDSSSVSSEPEKTDYAFLKENTNMRLIQDGDNRYVSEDGAFTVECSVSFSEGREGSARLVMKFTNNTDYDIVADCRAHPRMGINAEFTGDYTITADFEMGELDAHSTMIKSYDVYYETFLNDYANEDDNYWNDEGRNTVYLYFLLKIEIMGDEENNINGCGYYYGDPIMVSQEV